MVRVDGRISAIGLTAREEISIPWNLAIKKAARLTCSFSSTWTSWERSVGLLASGRVDVRPLITARISSPGTKPCASAKPSLTRISSAAYGVSIRPSRT